MRAQPAATQAPGPARAAIPGLAHTGGLSRKRFACAAGAAALLLAARVPAASAAKEWCTADPPIQVRVNGRPVTINVFVSVPQQDRDLLHTVRLAACVDDDRITVLVYGPRTIFKVYAEIKRLNLAAGERDEIYRPGEVVELRFDHVTR